MTVDARERWLAKHAPHPEILVSDWVAIEQPTVNLFSEATLEADPLHVDPDYARAHGPFGGTIGFGFQTLSLLTYFFRSCVPVPKGGYALNYGLNRARFPTAVRVGSRVRAILKLIDVEDRGNAKLLATYDVTVEIEHESRPALVAEWLLMWLDDSSFAT